jgi:hypothetical protein
MTEPELRDQLERLVEETLAEMMRSERVEPSYLSLIAGAAAAIRALDRGKQRLRLSSIRRPPPALKYF